MSLILDALKKLEQEKAARRQGMELGTAVVYGRRAARARRGFPLALSAGVLVLLVIAGLAAAKFLRHGAPVAAAPPAETAESRPAPVAPAAPPVPAPAAAPAAATPLPLPAATPRVLPPVSRPQQTPTTPAASEEAPRPAPTPGDLKVTGVAWQDERGSRRAVVNGLLLGEGAEVGGARIVEIRPDRVRFSRGGQELSLRVSTPFGK